MKSKEVTLLVSHDEQGLRINGYLIKIRKQNGIVSIENGSVGVGHSCHPNIDSSGSVKGMKNLGYWDKKDATVKAHGFIYNVSKIAISDDLDLLAYNIENLGYEIKPSVIEAAKSNKWSSVSITIQNV